MVLRSKRFEADVDLITRKRALDRELLLSFSEHLEYAVSAFSAYSLLAAFFGDHPKNLAARGSDDWWKGQALLSTYLVIARELDSFLYPEIAAHLSSGNRFERATIELDARKNKETVTSFDFVRDQESWLQRRPPRPDEISSLRSRINRTVVHFDLSRSRPDSETEEGPPSKKRFWEVGDIWNLFRPTLVTLLDEIDATLVFRDFEDQFQLALQAKATDLESLASYRYFERSDAP